MKRIPVGALRPPSLRGPGPRLALAALLVGLLAGCGGGAPGVALDVALDPAQPADVGRDSLAGATAPVVADTLEDAAALLGRSRALFQAGRHAEAIAFLAPHRAAWEAVGSGAARGWSREDARELLTRLALHQAASGAVTEAASIRATLCADTASNPLAASRLAYLELLGDDFARAAAPAARAWRADSTQAVRLNNVAITRLQAGDVAAAERLFLAAIDRQPELPGPYYNLAILAAFYRMDPEAGRRWFAEYRRRGSGDPDHLADALAGPEARADRDEGDAE